MEKYEVIRQPSTTTGKIIKLIALSIFMISACQPNKAVSSKALENHEEFNKVLLELNQEPKRSCSATSERIDIAIKEKFNVAHTALIMGGGPFSQKHMIKGDPKINEIGTVTVKSSCDTIMEGGEIPINEEEGCVILGVQDKNEEIIENFGKPCDLEESLVSKILSRVKKILKKKLH